jgi:glycosyltransferase involved in cell wall biosynthesis
MPWLYGKQRVLRVVLRAVHVLVTGTVTMRELYAKEFELPIQKIVVMPNWIDLSRFRHDGTKENIRRILNLPLDRKIVLFVHRLSHRKGADKIVQIASAVQEQSALFVVIGDGPLFKDLENTIERNGLKKDILLLGKIPHRDVASYFFASDVFIMPSEEEGFPNVLLEAMAAGLPFVATSVGGVRDIVPTVLQKYCVKSGDVAGFSERLVEFLKSESERTVVSNIGREHVKKYDQGVVVEQFLSMF